MFECGDISRAFDCKRFAFLRDLISDAGGVEWIDRKYIPGDKDEGIKGKCCKWKASEELWSRWHSTMTLKRSFLPQKRAFVQIIILNTHKQASTLGAALKPSRSSGQTHR